MGFFDSLPLYLFIDIISLFINWTNKDACLLANTNLPSIGPGIWLEWSYPKASIQLKIWGVRFPLSSSPLPSPFPSLFPSPSLPLPSFVPILRAAAPPKAARGPGERYKLPQWGLGRSPSWQTIWCISGPKGAALFCVSFFVGTTGPSYHSRIVCENDWISHFFTTFMH